MELIPADVLLITGDLTNTGSYEEIEAFNKWIGKIKHLFQKIIIIAGILFLITKTFLFPLFVYFSLLVSKSLNLYS